MNLTVILQDTYTLSQLKHKVKLLKNYLTHNFFTTGTNLKDAGVADLTWLKSLNHTFYQNFTKDNINIVFADLESQLNKLPILNIYLTFEPDQSTISSIGARSRKLFGSTLLLDIKFDPSLIAGAALVWKGIYKDYSLRAKIEEKKTEILTGFKKYLR